MVSLAVKMVAVLGENILVSSPYLPNDIGCLQFPDGFDILIYSSVMVSLAVEMVAVLGENIL